MKWKKRLQWQLSEMKNLNFEKGNGGTSIDHMSHFDYIAAVVTHYKDMWIDLWDCLDRFEVFSSAHFSFSLSYVFSPNKNFSNYGNSACI